MTKTALILVDIQYDFIPPDGSLAVNEGDQILLPVYRLLDEAADRFDLIVASKACFPNLCVVYAIRRLILRLVGLYVRPVLRERTHFYD
jgi:hypothetical protein